jgi:phosphoglycolate phosphatase
MSRLSNHALHPARPRAVLFDWHGTLVDTRHAMYRAVDDMLKRPDASVLLQRRVPVSGARTIEDARRVQYVRTHRRLHPRIAEEGRVSRTDLFEILFGDDEEAKEQAHSLFSECYRNHFGDVRLLDYGATAVLHALREQGLRVGIVTNRDREFLERELAQVGGGGWPALFNVIVSGGDAAHRKPAPDGVFMALAALEMDAGRDVWLIGDSASDVATAKRAGVTSIFFHSAHWSAAWLAHYFPGTPEHPYVPDAIVKDFADLARLLAATGAVPRGTPRRAPGARSGS